jgi:hypothetical protein
LSLAVLLAAVAAIAVVADWWLGHTSAHRLTLRIDGRRRVRRGHDRRPAAAEMGLRPRAGNLLDVEGELLRRGPVPDRLLLDGEPAAADTRLRSDDRIRVVDGRRLLTVEVPGLGGGWEKESLLPRFFLQVSRFL